VRSRFAVAAAAASVVAFLPVPGASGSRRGLSGAASESSCLRDLGHTTAKLVQRTLFGCITIDESYSLSRPISGGGTENELGHCNVEVLMPNDGTDRWHGNYGYSLDRETPYGGAGAEENVTETDVSVKSDTSDTPGTYQSPVENTLNYFDATPPKVVSLEYLVTGGGYATPTADSSVPWHLRVAYVYGDKIVSSPSSTSRSSDHGAVTQPCGPDLSDPNVAKHDIRLGQSGFHGSRTFTEVGPFPGMPTSYTTVNGAPVGREHVDVTVTYDLWPQPKPHSSR
jgi:hypothetical protein